MMPLYEKETNCTHLHDKRSRQCHSCRMKNNPPRAGSAPDWKFHSSGYITKFIDNRWQYQHRYVMEQHLNRLLLSCEHVHHIDHDKTNNPLSNLVVLSATEHGQHHMTSERASILSKLAHSVRYDYVPSL